MSRLPASAQVCAFPPSTTIYIADPAIAKVRPSCAELSEHNKKRVHIQQEVIGARARFPKALDVYKLLSTFGSNILVTEGDEWKRQRKITAPAFSEVCMLSRCPMSCGGCDL